MAKIKRSDLRSSLKNKEVSIENTYKLFLRSRKSRCTQAAIRIYTEKQKNIVDGFSRVGVENMIAINPPSICAVIADYQDSHSYNCAWKLFTVIRTFLLWYWDEYELADCPIRKVKVKNPTYQPKQGISRADIDKMISAAKRSSKFPERDVCLIMMLSDTDLRKKSIQGLRMKDVNTDKNTINVFEKDQNYINSNSGLPVYKKSIVFK